MGKTKGKLNWLTKWCVAFLAIATVFLAVGLGTLGSTATVGDAYELKTSRNGEMPKLIVNLKYDDSEEYTSGGETLKRDVRYELVSVCLNVASVYAEAGTPGMMRMQYSSSDSSFSATRRCKEVAIENFFTVETPVGEEEAANSENVIPTVHDALFRWTAPFDDSLADWSTSYSFFCFTALDRDLLINEVVFVGKKLVRSGSSSDYTETGELAAIPATVHSATPNSDETPEAAKARAQAALFDAQEVPSAVQSSHAVYAKEELYTLSTLAEMRRGGEYDEALTSSAYHVEGVYGSLGIDLIALGTDIFGTSPFGIRFFPMLASFGVLVFGYLFVRQLTRSERAGIVFAALYALSGLSLTLGHLGTPLMIGLFFFTAALYFCHKFYARGMKHAGLLGALPLILSGIFSAAAICVNGVYILPVAGLVGLFACGLVRQQRAKRYHLDAAIAEAEAEGAPEESKEKVARVVEEYRSKNLGACVGFGLTLVICSVLFALLFAIPLYTPYLRLYTNATSANIFTLAANAFAGGFVGHDPGVGTGAWELAVLYEGTGARYAVTVAIVNAAAAAAAILGVVFAAYSIIRIILKKQLGRAERSELRATVIPLAGLALSLILTSFGGGALGFLVLSFLFAFALAAHAVAALWKGEGKIALAAKICTWVGLGLLIAVFALFAVFTFSIPVSASLLTSIFG